jgi:Holliday junction DNA helicase RuvB
MSSEGKITAPYPLEGELELDRSLRPTRFEDFVGQERIKENLRVFVGAAKKRREALDHVLFSGPPGLGKTTLAHIIANELGVKVKPTSGPTLQKPFDLAGILSKLREGEVFFIDEIHRLSPAVEESLYSAMEDGVCHAVLDRGVGAKTVDLHLKNFTLVGATTRAGLLTSPLRSRFGVISRLDYYGPKELQQIVLRSARILKVAIDSAGAKEIAKRSRGTPRVANRLLRRVRDYAQVKADGKITRRIAAMALGMLEVDEMGLDEMDKRIIQAILEKFGGGPVGLNTLAVAVGEEKDTIEEVYEPFLVQEGLIQRTPRGRIATDRARKHLHLDSAEDSQQSLF